MKKVKTSVGLDSQFHETWVLAAQGEAAAEPILEAMSSFLVHQFNYRFDEHNPGTRMGNVVGIECLGSKLLLAIGDEGWVQSHKLVSQHFSAASRLLYALRQA